MTRRFASRAHRDSETKAGTRVTAPSQCADAGRGEALDPAVRVEMELRLGHDFSAVRLHADADAERLTDEFSARAFTSGNDVFFGAGAYAPTTPRGRHLLAHELSHVVQQEQFGTPGGRDLSHAHDAAELEARAAADAVVAGGSASIQTASSAAIARDEDDDKPDLSPLNDSLNDKSPFGPFRFNPFPQQKPDPLDNPRADSQKDWDKWEAERRGDKYPSPLTDPKPVDPKDPHRDPLYWKDWSKPAPDVPPKKAPEDEPIPGPGDYPMPDDDLKYA